MRRDPGHRLRLHLLRRGEALGDRPRLPGRSAEDGPRHLPLTGADLPPREAIGTPRSPRATLRAMLKTLAVLRTIFLVFIIGYTVRAMPFFANVVADVRRAVRPLRATALSLLLRAAWIAIAWIAFETARRLVARDAPPEARAPRPQAPGGEPPFAPPGQRASPRAPAATAPLPAPLLAPPPGRDGLVRPALPAPALRPRGGRRASSRAAPTSPSGGCASRARSRRRDPAPPRRITYDDLARVHAPELLESLGRPEALAHDLRGRPVRRPGRRGHDHRPARLRRHPRRPRARRSARSAPALNLLGGFHHAAPGAAGGFCPVNDIAVAVAALRAEGFTGRVAVLDLDAHPPDGIAACLASDPRRWIGSLSGSDWGPLEDVDETVLPEGDRRRGVPRRARARCSARMPRPHLAFVHRRRRRPRRRPLREARAHARGRARARPPRRGGARGRPARSGCPGGGYSDRAWRVLAGTGMALAAGSREPIPPDYDPLDARFARVVARALADRAHRHRRAHRRRPRGGARDPAAAAARSCSASTPRPAWSTRSTGSGSSSSSSGWGTGSSAPRSTRPASASGSGVFGEAEAQEHLLVELVARAPARARRRGAVRALAVAPEPARAVQRSPARGCPGQDVPGLGLAREAGDDARADGGPARARRRRVPPRVLPHRLRRAPRVRVHRPRAAGPVRGARARSRRTCRSSRRPSLVAEGRVLMDGEPYAWEADEMAYWLRESPADAGEVERERERGHGSRSRSPAGARQRLSHGRSASSRGPRPRAPRPSAASNPRWTARMIPAPSTTSVVGSRVHVEAPREARRRPCPTGRGRTPGSPARNASTSAAVLVERDARTRRGRGRRTLAREPIEQGQLLAARLAPARPEVDDDPRLSPGRARTSTSRPGRGPARRPRRGGRRAPAGRGAGVPAQAATSAKSTNDRSRHVRAILPRYATKSAAISGSFRAAA